MVELASNDGYLLQHFVERGIPALGHRARRQRRRGGAASAGSRRWSSSSAASSRRASSPRAGSADLVVGNNVLAQVPDLNDFVAGMKPLLAPEGVVTIEFPHLVRLIDENQFDTIYHEHFSYFSFLTVAQGPRGARARGVRRRGAGDPRRLAARLRAARRAAARPIAPARRPSWPSASARRLDTLEGHSALRAAGDGDQVAAARVPDRARGARASGSPATALRARATRCSTTAGSAPTCSSTRSIATRTSRAGSCPGTHIPIRHPGALEQTRPDYILILPWNLKDEIVAQLAYTREWGARCVVPIPEVEVL